MTSQNSVDPESWADLSIAVVGAGYWGQNLVRTMSELGVLTGVCDAFADRLVDMGRRYGCDTYADYDDVLANADIDAVVIATPAESHADLVRRSLEAGKDVFVEKPLCFDTDVGQDLVSTAASLNRVLMVGHLLWYHPAILKLASIVREGELGRLRHLSSSRLNFGKFRVEENVLWSFAPHDVSVILGLVDTPPTDVWARGGNYLSPAIADTAVALLSFPEGVQAHINVSWLNPFKEQRLVVVGDKAMAVFEDTLADDKLKLYPHEIEWDGPIPSPVKHEAEVVPYDKAAEPLLAECVHFLERIVDRKEPRTGGAEGLRVLDVLNRCQAAMDRTRQ